MEATVKEIIYEGNSTVSIETLPDYPQPVVIKRPSKPHASRRHILSLEKEYEMTRSLDTVEGVRKVIEKLSIENQPALILEYIDGETLRDTIARQTLDLRSRLEIAVDLAGILGRIHQQNVIHLDLNSKNILIANEPQAARLIDLGSAARIDRSGQQRIRPDQMLGTLPYIAPEQTGRINRAVDERSDLYSLGVVYYELMTWQLPFDSKDTSKLVHDHIARVPVSPSEVSSEIPEMLSAIILKLLSKNAENRYQSAAGVQADLEKCLQRLSPKDTIEEFPLGKADYTGWLRFPQKLYGRSPELSELESAFESVCLDTSSSVFVGGYSGIGKTALVEEIQRPVSEKSGYFIKGKFDQFVTTPYAGISQGLAAFVSQILAQPETRLTAWRSRILEAVGPNGRVVMDVVPTLELVIGPQPAVPDLSGEEAQNRFNYVFQRFFGAIARREHPICFFLDDLQWVDPSSLYLLKTLFSSPDLAHLLVVGAYRDNEVQADHPLITLIADLEEADANLKQIILKRLSAADIEAMISDTLKRDPSEVLELSRLFYSKTDGNPFFTRQVLRSMQDQGLIALDTATGRWRWDMDTLKDMDFTTSVIELLVSKLEELPAGVQETLKVAACMGNQFDIATLTVVTAGDDEAILDHVREAVAAGLIWERDDGGFFVHDRIQEAAYTLVPIEERDRLHLTIGLLILQRHRASDDEQDLYRIVDQLNRGLRLVEDEQERMQIARLNLQAAQATRQATAFDAGLNYAQAGIELLGEDAWERHYRLTLELEEQAALLAYAAGDIPKAEHHGQQVLRFGRDPVDLARVQRMRIEILIASNRPEEALDVGLEALRLLGQEFPANPDWELATAKVAELQDRIERENTDFISIAPLGDQDPCLAATAEILMRILAAAFLCRPALGALISVRRLELCLDRQLLPVSTPGGLASHGVYCSGLLGKTEVAYALGETAIRLAGLPAFSAHETDALHLHGKYMYFWRGHLRDTLDLFVRSIRVGRYHGNHDMTAYSAYGWSEHAFYASIELEEAQVRSLELRVLTDSIHHENMSRYVNIYITAAQTLRQSFSARGASWNGTPFDDDWDLPDLHKVADRLGLLNVYTAKAWVATLFGDQAAAEEHSDLACSFLDAGPGAINNATMAFICGLRYARELRENPDRPESEQALQEQLILLERFAGPAPMNFAHKLSLVQAEVHRARGEVVQAMQSFEKASQGARENGYLNEAGLAYALAAEFYQDLGLQQAALHNLGQAVQAWGSWGAHALVENLRHRFADLLEHSDLSWQSSSDVGKVHTTIAQPVTPIQLDTESIVSASQMLSAETDLEQLLSKMITLVMANSGAETAVLLLKQENDWFVQARVDSTSEKYDVLLNQPFDPADRKTDLIPESVFNYCRRTREVLVVGDAQVDHRFAGDRMIQKHNTQSLACLPSLSQGELKAILYLENRQTADVFTLENLSILKHLSAQFAVSVENALLYDNLNRLVEARTVHLQDEIEERKQAEAALQASEVEYRDLVEKTSDVIYAVDPEGVVTYVNPAVESLIGLPPERIIGQRFSQFVHREDLGRMQNNIQSLYTGIVPGSTEYRVRTTTGETRWILVRSQPIKEGDHVTGLQGVLTDITERKKVEAHLKEAAAVAARQRLARDLHDSVTQGIYSASLIAETLQVVWEDDPEQGRRGLEQIERLTRGALAELRTLLLEMQPEALTDQELPFLIRQLADTMMARANTSISTTLLGDCEVPTEDKIALYRITQEALNNVVKHSQARHAKINLEGDCEQIILRISDDGIGFEPENPQFHGIGISIMNSRVRDIDASLTITSQPGKGTEVLVTQPGSTHE